MAPNPLLRLYDHGQSVWLDFITRELMDSGELDRLIAEDGLRGMTSNPTIFEQAITNSGDYDVDIARHAGAGSAPADIFEALAVADVRRACDAFAEVYRETQGSDGLVSLEVSPLLAHRTDETVAEARRLWQAVDRPNLMIKIPGTKAGLPAVRRALAEGINVNITLLFDVDRYAEVMEAHLAALEERVAAGQPIDRVASVASFFVSRVDTKVDPELERLNAGPELRSKAAIANAAMAYQLYERMVHSHRWTRLAEKGALAGRPLWASTSTKDARLSDVFYVEALIAPDTVNTLPPATLAAYRDHGNPSVRIHDAIAVAPAQLAALDDAGIDLSRVTAELEEEGVAKFADSYTALLGAIEAKAGELARA